jgi:hypothetical protein
MNGRDVAFIAVYAVGVMVFVSGVALALVALA